MDSYLSLIGTRGAGKSTCAGLLLLTALDMANEVDSKLTVRVEERTFPIRTLTDALQRGYFPPPTEEDKTFEATVTLAFRRNLLQTSHVSLAIADVAGETLSQLLTSIENGNEFKMPDMQRLKHVNSYVVNASSFMLLTDMQVLVTPKLDTEIATQDAQLARFIDLLSRYKRIHKGSPSIKGVALVLSKYDEVQDLLAVRDRISLDYREGMISFLKKYMIQTYTALCNEVGEGLIDVFYSSVYPELDADGRETDRIKIIPETRRPQYSTGEYQRLLAWMGQMFK